MKYEFFNGIKYFLCFRLFERSLCLLRRAALCGHRFLKLRFSGIQLSTIELLTLMNSCRDNILCISMIKKCFFNENKFKSKEN